MQSNRLIPLIIGVIFIGIAIYLAFNLIEVSKNLIAKIGLGWVLATVIARTLVCFAFARGAQLIFKAVLPRVSSILVFLIGIVAGFGLSFASPIYQSDYGDFSTADLTIDHTGLTEITNGRYQIKQQPYVIAFFTTNCPHCKEASARLGFQQKLGKTPPIVAIFPGNAEDTRDFLSKYNGEQFEILRLDSHQEFFKINSGAAFPSTFLINEKGETMRHWFGDLLNYSALDYIGSFKK